MGLFDVVKNARIPELGKIKIGGKQAQERKGKDGATWRLPEKHDHFTITTLHRDARGDLIPDKNLMENLKKEYADHDGQLRSIPIALLSNEIEDVMQAAYVRYSGKRVAARSDGITLWKYYKGKEWLDEPSEEEWKPEYAEQKDGNGNTYYKLHTKFSCVISVQKAHWGGVYLFRTTSQITASQLAGSLLEIKQLTGGILRGLPLRLAMRPMQVSPGGKTTTVYVVHCELIGDDLLAIQNMAMERARCELKTAKQLSIAQLEYKRLIHAPGIGESPLEQAEVAEEFHPEQVEPDVKSLPPAATDPLVSQLGLEPTNGHTEPAAEKAPETPEMVPEHESDQEPDAPGDPSTDWYAVIAANVALAGSGNDVARIQDEIDKHEDELTGLQIKQLKEGLRQRMQEVNSAEAKKNGSKKPKPATTIQKKEYQRLMENVTSVALSNDLQEFGIVVPSGVEPQKYIEAFATLTEDQAERLLKPMREWVEKHSGTPT